MNPSTLLFFLALVTFGSSDLTDDFLSEFAPSMPPLDPDSRAKLEWGLRIEQAVVGCEPFVTDYYDMSQRQGKAMLEMVRHCSQDLRPLKNGWRIRSEIALADMVVQMPSHFEPVAPPSKIILDEFRKIPDALKICGPTIEDLDRQDWLEVLDACIKDFDSNFSECASYGLWCRIKLRLKDEDLLPFDTLTAVANWKRRTLGPNFKF